MASLNAPPDPSIPWWVTYLPLLVLGIVIAVRFRRLERARPLRPRVMLTAPVIYAIIIVGLFMLTPPPPLGWLAFAGGIAIGALAGWQRARLMRLHVDPDHGRVMVRQSPAALFLILGLAFARRLILPRHIDIGEDGTPPPSLLAVTDGLFGFALGMIGTQAIVLWRKARTLIAEHRSE